MNLKKLGRAVQLNLPLAQDDKPLSLTTEEREELIQSLADLFAGVLENPKSFEEGGSDESKNNS